MAADFIQMRMLNPTMPYSIPVAVNVLHIVNITPVYVVMKANDKTGTTDCFPAYPTDQKDVENRGLRRTFQVLDSRGNQFGTLPGRDDNAIAALEQIYEQAVKD